jgi:hypothetical protein
MRSNSTLPFNKKEKEKEKEKVRCELREDEHFIQNAKGI